MWDIANAIIELWMKKKIKQDRHMAWNIRKTNVSINNDHMAGWLIRTMGINLLKEAAYNERFTGNESRESVGSVLSVQWKENRNYLKRY